MDRFESKYFNTAVKMDKAFLSLLENKELDYITVKEICEKSGVNRSTFYLHYETIADLLQEAVAFMHQKFLEKFGKIQNIDVENSAQKQLIFIKPEYLFPYLEYVKENRKVYKTALKYPQIFGADKTYRNIFRDVFDPVMERFQIPENERQFRMGFYMKGIEGIIAKWLEEDCKEPIETIMQVIQSCIPVGNV